MAGYCIELSKKHLVFMDIIPMKEHLLRLPLMIPTHRSNGTELLVIN